MKARKIFINIAVLPLWLLYFGLTANADKGIFLNTTDEWLLALIIAVFTIYNLCSAKTWHYIVSHLTFLLFFAGALFLSGQMYLRMCHHTSDCHEAVISIPIEYILETAIIAVIGFALKLITILIQKLIAKRKENSENIDV